VGMMKKESIVALLLFLLIPVDLFVGGLLFSVINPELAAGHPNYVRNYHLLNTLKISCIWAAFAVAVVLWVLVCLQVIRAKKQSKVWLLLAALGPLGFVVLATLDDRAPAETDTYARFTRRMNWLMRAAYEVCTFAIVWELAYAAMVLKRMVMIHLEAATTGVPTAQIIAVQNASSGMWAFGESLEVMFLAVLLYLLRPTLVRVASRVAARRATPRPT